MRDRLRGQPVGLVEDHERSPRHARRAPRGSRRAAGRRRTSAGRSPRRTRRPARAPGRPRRGAPPPGVEVGQVEQHQAVQARAPPARCARRRGAAPRPRASPAARRRPPPPTRLPSGCEVVGRRAPTVATSAPTRALNRLDLPAAGGAGERDDGVAPGDRGPLADSSTTAAAPGRRAPGRAPRHPASSASASAAPRRRMSSADDGRDPRGAHLQRAHRTASTAAAAAERRLRLLRSAATAVEGRVVAGLLARRTARRSVEQLLPGLGRQVAHRLVAEDSPRAPAGRAAPVPPAMPTSAPDRPTGVAERGEHQDHADPVEPVGQRCAPSVRRSLPSLAHEVEHLALPVAHQALDPRREVRRRPWRAGVGLRAAAAPPGS